MISSAYREEGWMEDGLAPQNQWEAQHLEASEEEVRPQLEQMDTELKTR